MDDKRQLLRHFLATLAYRTQKALRGAPPNFSQFVAGAGVRTPHQLIRHMTGVLMYAHSHFRPYDSTYPPALSWEDELDRFHETLQNLDKDLAASTPLRGTSLECLLQGPLSDAMTHAGQLALLRRLAGSPVPAENFIQANIRIGQVGPNQPEPVSPDKE